jgi:hypothetical protein
MLSKSLNHPLITKGLPTYRSVMDELFNNEGYPKVEKTIDQIGEMLKKVDEVLGRESRWKEEGMSWEEVWKETGMSKDEFEENVVRPFEVRAERLKVWKRGKHVVSLILTTTRTASLWMSIYSIRKLRGCTSLGTRWNRYRMREVTKMQ